MVGGSPAARPISRWAIAKRVTLSIMQSTCASVVAEMLGESQRQEGGLAAHQGGLVRRRDDHDRARKALVAEILLEELLHLTAALADEADDGDVRGGIARQHRKKHGLADARAGENAHALATAAGGEGVEHAHAKIEGLPDPAARVGRRRIVAQHRQARTGRQRTLSVDGLAHAR